MAIDLIRYDHMLDTLSFMSMLIFILSATLRCLFPIILAASVKPSLEFLQKERISSKCWCKNSNRRSKNLSLEFWEFHLFIYHSSCRQKCFLLDKVFSLPSITCSSSGSGVMVLVPVVSYIQHFLNVFKFQIYHLKLNLQPHQKRKLTPQNYIFTI